MAQTAQALSKSRDLPPCFKRLRSSQARVIGEEIYDILLSLQKLLPEGAREYKCPASAIGELRSNYIVCGVMRGWRFPALDFLDTSEVKFVGVAAGALEAARIGAVNPLVQAALFKRVRQLSATLSERDLVPLRRRTINREVVGRVQGISASGLGQTNLESFHSVQLVGNRRGDIYEVWTLRVIDVRFHPRVYSFPEYDPQIPGDRRGEKQQEE